MNPDSIVSNKRHPWVNVTLIVFLTVAGLYLAARFASHHTVAQLFVFVMFYAIVFLDLLFVKKSVEKGDLDIHTLCKLAAISVLAGFVLEGLTVLGSPGSHFSNPEDWSKRRAAVFTVAAFLVAQYACLKSKARTQQGKPSLDIAAIGPCKLSLVAFVLVVSVVLVFRIGARFPMAFYVLGAFALCVAVLLFACKSISLSVAFFLMVFISGSMIMYGVPITTGLSWDDQIHYENAADSSYLIQTQMTDTEVTFSREAIERALGNDAVSVTVFDVEEIERHANELDRSYRDDIAAGRVAIDKTEESVFELNRIGYVPMAVGLWIGRLTHLSFSSMLILAKLCNLLSFSSVVALAIYVAPSKKGIFALVGLLPTSVWQAANLSYDPWLISFVMLGFAYYLRFAWGEKVDFTKKNVALAFTFTFVGLAVKAVYFPVIGLYFLVPRERFSSSAQRGRYNAAVFFLGFFTFASFALPYLFASGTGTGDVRGGTEVDSGRQLAYILSNPVQYASTLGSFLFGEYFSLANSNCYAFDFAYLGNAAASLPVGVISGVVTCAPAAALAVFGVSANDEASVKRVSLRASLWALFLTLFTFVLVATALYLSFTPVASHTVLGCQFRYILPMLVPSMSMILNNRWLVLGEKKNWQVFCLTLSLFFFALCFLALIVARSI